MENYKFNLSDLKTGHAIACYSNDTLGKVEIFVERGQLARFGLPENYPIPTHIANIVVYKQAFTIKGQAYQPGIYVYEAKENGFNLHLFTDVYKPDSNIRLIEPTIPFTELEQEMFRIRAEDLYKKSKGYGDVNFALEPFHTFLDLDFEKALATNDSRVICSASYAICFNYARVRTFMHPAMDTPLEIVVNNNVKFMDEIKTT
jgi:hypothetical protein